MSDHANKKLFEEACQSLADAVNRADNAEHERDLLRDALKDMLGGWRYIRKQHGDLYGVGWDRAEQKAVCALGEDDGLPKLQRGQPGPKES